MSSEPIVEQLDATADLYRHLLGAAGQGLGIPISGSSAGVSSPLALSLYSEGVVDYAAARVFDAHLSLQTALAFEPNSPILNEAFRWVDEDLEGSQSETPLAEVYRRLLKLPDSDAALDRRLTRAHNLARPSWSALQGKEAVSPYKRPRPEVGP